MHLLLENGGWTRAVSSSAWPSANRPSVSGLHGSASPSWAVVAVLAK